MKMTNKILAALLIVCSLFTLVACGGEGSGIEYTKGTIENNVYTNEWADIKFVLDDTTWKKGSDADFKSYENENTDCGLVAGASTEGRQLAIAFEKNPLNLYDEKAYLDNCTKLLKETGLGYSIGEYYKKTIAGKEYLAMDITLSQSGVTVHQAMLTKLHDGKFISIVATSATSKDEINKALDKITTVK